ncbi:MAG: hypothetical protein LV480_04090 [Methylacidiphilales bacterium]|nr:hypothetical protein [Candidatus Methylacidiphilales bacterium]
MIKDMNGWKVWVGAAALFLALMPFHCAKALTADELARHLGVQVWETTVDLPRGTFSVALFSISEGKVGQAIGAGFGGDANDPNECHLVIMANPDRGKPHVTIMLGGASASNYASHFSENFLPLAGTLELPKKIKPGDYLLGGTWKMKNGVMVATDNAADVESGLLLRVMAN